MERAQRLGGVAFLTTIAGGVILLPSYLWELPIAILLVGSALWIGGLILACVAAVRIARAERVGFLRGLWTVIRTASRWVWEFMP